MLIPKNPAFPELTLIEHGPWKDTPGLSLNSCLSLTHKFYERTFLLENNRKAFSLLVSHLSRHTGTHAKMKNRCFVNLVISKLLFLVECSAHLMVG